MKVKIFLVYIEQLDFNNSEEYHINSYFCRKFVSRFKANVCF